MTARPTLVPVPGPRADVSMAAPKEARADPVDILARTIYGEARGESVRGREAVAAAIINRVDRAARFAAARLRHRWGRTVSDVCLKPSQFSCWNGDGPNRERILAAAAGEPDFDICLRIARRAVAGVLNDPTGGATHYHAKGVLPAWSDGHAPCTTIGNHLFYDDVE